MRKSRYANSNMRRNTRHFTPGQLGQIDEANEHQNGGVPPLNL